MQLELNQLDRRYAALRISERGRTQRLVASLVEVGQQTPVLVVRSSEDERERFVLIDGYARIDALRLLARDVVEASVLELPEAEALIVGFQLDATRHRSALEEAWLLQELRDGHGLGQDDLARKLGRSKSWVSRRLALVNVLPVSVQQAVQDGQVSGQAATKCLVPLARANAKHCERLIAQLGGAHLSVRDAGRLYDAWRKGDAEQRERLVEHPSLFLQAEQAARTSEDAGANEDIAAVAGDLGAVAGICARARKRLDKRDVAVADDVQRRVLGRAWERARESFGSLSARLSEEKL